MLHMHTRTCMSGVLMTCLRPGGQQQQQQQQQQKLQQQHAMAPPPRPQQQHVVGCRCCSCYCVLSRRCCQALLSCAAVVCDCMPLLRCCGIVGAVVVHVVVLFLSCVWGWWWHGPGETKLEHYFSLYPLHRPLGQPRCTSVLPSHNPHLNSTAF